jgi:WD40 repeat protein
VKLWDVASHQLIATLTGHTDIINVVTFSPNGRMLATGSADHTIPIVGPGHNPGHRPALPHHRGSQPGGLGPAHP